MQTIKTRAGSASILCNKSSSHFATGFQKDQLGSDYTEQCYLSGFRKTGALLRQVYLRYDMEDGHTFKWNYIFGINDQNLVSAI